MRAPWNKLLVDYLYTFGTFYIGFYVAIHILWAVADMLTGAVDYLRSII